MCVSFFFARTKKHQRMDVKMEFDASERKVVRIRKQNNSRAKVRDLLDAKNPHPGSGGRPGNRSFSTYFLHVV